LFWLQSGLSNQGLTLDMPTGRLDGFVSSAAEANSLLVSSQSTAEQLTQQFAQQGFSQDEMITLSGTTYEANAPTVAASVMLQVFPS
jgi:peroxidase